MSIVTKNASRTGFQFKCESGHTESTSLIGGFLLPRYLFFFQRNPKTWLKIKPSNEAKSIFPFKIGRWNNSNLLQCNFIFFHVLIVSISSPINRKHIFIFNLNL
uniref:Uncharacterized protein n=1 Tax=Cacopsylla melanoneura TaxID=428564 RepID=A0A8D9BB02_9HEMI